MVMSASLPQGESLLQRELRNESGHLLRAVSEGHSFVLANRETPVGRVVPLEGPAPTLPIVRPSKRIGGWAALKPEQTASDRTMAQILDELREDRV